MDATVSLVAGLGLSVAAARGLGPDLLGVYNYAMWLIGVAKSVATSGIAFGMQQFAAERLGRGDAHGAEAVLRWGARWALGLALLLVALGAAVTWAFSPPSLLLALLIAVASAVPAILGAAPAAGLIAAQAYGGNAFASVCADLVNLVSATSALAVGLGLTGLTLALLLSRLVDVSLRYVAWRRVWRRFVVPFGGPPDRRRSALDLPRMHRFAWRSSILLLIDMVVWDRSEFLVLMYVGSPREIAFYALGFNIVQQVLSLPRILSAALSSNLQLERGRNPQGVIVLSRDVIRYVFLIAAPSMLGLASIAGSIVPLLYGQRYEPAIRVLTIVAGLAVLRGAVVPVQELLRMSEQQAWLIRFALILGLVNISLDVWLIPRHGAIGAAWANGLAQAMATLGMMAYAAWRLGLAVPVGDMTRILLACAPVVLLGRLLTGMFDHWVVVFLAVPLGAVVYALGLRWLRVIRPDDTARLAIVGRLLPPALRPTWERAVLWIAIGDAVA